MCLTSGEMGVLILGKRMAECAETGLVWPPAAYEYVAGVWGEEKAISSRKHNVKIMPFCRMSGRCTDATTRLNCSVIWLLHFPTFQP
jgi:hypothetical protein